MVVVAVRVRGRAGHVGAVRVLPAFSTFTDTSITTVWPGSRSPRSQEKSCPEPLQLPTGVVAPAWVRFSGSVSVTVTRGRRWGRGW